jgi:hypothetical protein
MHELVAEDDQSTQLSIAFNFARKILWFSDVTSGHTTYHPYSVRNTHKDEYLCNKKESYN